MTLLKKLYAAVYKWVMDPTPIPGVPFPFSPYPKIPKAPEPPKRRIECSNAGLLELIIEQSERKKRRSLQRKPHKL
jgi:hypothetical protein